MDIIIYDKEKIDILTVTTKFINRMGLVPNIGETIVINPDDKGLKFRKVIGKKINANMNEVIIFV